MIINTDQTPWTYEDKIKQRKNEMGHAAQNEFFHAAACGEGPGGIEFKYDQKRMETGNWFIEFKGNLGQDSGISKTQAEYWLMMTEKGHCLFTTVRLLRQYLEQEKPRIFKGGEGSEGYLIKDDGHFQKWVHELFSKNKT